MATKRNKRIKRNIRIKNKTKKNTSNSNSDIPKPLLKILPNGYPLYASKKYEGATILEYNREEERKHHDKCLMTNSSWFGDLAVAKSYKTKDTHIYKWSVDKQTNLLKIDKNNQSFIDYIFKKGNIKLVPAIHLAANKMKDIQYSHPYLSMTNNERALYEFQFCFGFLSVQEQYNFMNFVKFLLENKLIEIKTREGDSILQKLNLKIYYYKVGSLFGKKEYQNRLSFYEFDKHAIMNLCKIVHHWKYKINGVYQKNDTSFWFPDFKVYKMNIQEYILFNPQDNLVYDTLIE